MTDFDMKKQYCLDRARKEAYNLIIIYTFRMKGTFILFNHHFSSYFN